MGLPPSSSSGQQPLPDRNRKSESKRKRDRGEDEDEEMGEERGSSPSRAIRGAGNLVPKRIRAGLGRAGWDPTAGNDEGEGFGIGRRGIREENASTMNTKLGGDVDLGKMLGEWTGASLRMGRG